MFTLHHQFYDNIEDILDDIEFVKKEKDLDISNVSSVFDIETSSFYTKDDEKRSIMYAFVLGINGKCVRGRTWEEFEYYLNKIIVRYNINVYKRFIIYVHNLSFEFQFLRKRFEWCKIFSLDKRTPIYAVTTSGIEFRCSYILSNLGLEKLGNDLIKYSVKKAVGDLDYKLIRHSETPLNDTEWGYILNDGLVVMAYIQEEIERSGNISKLPYTNTGYVRNFCRNATIKSMTGKNYVRLIKKLTMTSEDYVKLKRAFMGGFTHANHFKVGKIHKDVASFDETSAYPSVMVSEKFPMSKAMKCELKTTDEFIDKIKNYCCVFDVKFKNIRETFNYEHYITSSKCYILENYILDNGRVVEADELAITLTEVDFKIIQKTYKWDSMTIYNFTYYEKDYLPRELLLAVLTLYKNKTELKGVEGKEYLYQKSKAMLNSVYGMCVTDPCKYEVLYENDMWNILQGDIEELIRRYNSNNLRFIYYPWGIYITAYARLNLWRGILEFKEDYIYSDTDSLKVSNYQKHLEWLDKYNRNVTAKINECLEASSIPRSLAYCKTIKGVVKPLGVFDFEGVYSHFKTLGAKRYMFIQDNKLNITISGVSKKYGSEYLINEYKSPLNALKHFNDDLYFPATYMVGDEEHLGTGKLVHTYIDELQYGYVTDYLGQPLFYREFSSTHLENASYSLSLDDLFLMYLFGDTTSIFTK